MLNHILLCVSQTAYLIYLNRCKFWHIYIIKNILSLCKRNRYFLKICWTVDSINKKPFLLYICFRQPLYHIYHVKSYSFTSNILYLRHIPTRLFICFLIFGFFNFLLAKKWIIKSIQNNILLKYACRLVDWRFSFVTIQNNILLKYHLNWITWSISFVTIQNNILLKWTHSLSSVFFRFVTIQNNILLKY